MRMCRNCGTMLSLLSLSWHPQLWPGILSMKVCLPVEVLMALYSSGTQGKNRHSKCVCMLLVRLV